MPTLSAFIRSSINPHGGPLQLLQRVPLLPPLEVPGDPRPLPVALQLLTCFATRVPVCLWPSTYHHFALFLVAVALLLAISSLPPCLPAP